MNKEELEKLYLGKTIHVIAERYYPNDQFTYNTLDAWGKVTRVTEQGGLIGTWSSVEVFPGKDYVGLED